MEHVFTDGVGSITVVNGNVRIELRQIVRDPKNAGKLVSEPTTTLIMPLSSLKDATVKLANTMEKIQADEKAKAQMDKQAEDEDALTQL
ncbi:hypothetical protein WH95_13485 [Kiloniella litopenaei]|uniref:Uncharacterized protein n=1 Tax=Kiloniella litopenaei TaxID=1549748 RepID=A0A0M2R476_9PROT|nr:hypothetical protein [Kiloniella litopenaei]KKJ76476.1 hypothetical protein WH95_13485 [Kiloniella litopenaei]